MDTKIHSIDELKDIKSKYKDSYNGSNCKDVVRIKVALATCGIASGAKEIMADLQQKLKQNNIDAIVTQTGCMGYCFAEPTIEVSIPNKPPVVFGKVTTDKVSLIIDKYIKQGELTDGIIPMNYRTI